MRVAEGTDHIYRRMRLKMVLGLLVCSSHAGRSLKTLIWSSSTPVSADYDSDRDSERLISFPNSLVLNETGTVFNLYIARIAVNR